MASAKFNPLSYFPPLTPLPTQRSPSPQVHLTPFKNPSTLRLKTQLVIPVLLPKISPKKTNIEEEEKENPHNQPYESPDSLTVAFPSLKFSNTLFFNSAYNIQVVVGDDEPEEKLIGRFRREVLKAGVLQECKRRRFFESTQEKRKRKAREAAKRNKKRRPRPKVSTHAKAETSKKTEDPDDDNWEFLDIDLPYS
ncbi:hypothetical protein DH2020_038653 [Rehmannia glutinosa]|uniref:30S ribosomal protein S21, chloroplastic n=1 Tax=Rehmannia glutinosa TaxID=99300 RepID=A0ABR0UZY5_REHGL